MLRRTHLAVGNHPELEKEKQGICMCVTVLGGNQTNFTILLSDCKNLHASY